MEVSRSKVAQATFGLEVSKEEPDESQKEKNHVKIICIRIYRNSILTQMFRFWLLFMEIVDLLKNATQVKSALIA